MSVYHSNIKSAKEILRADGYYRSLESVLEWDETQSLPVAGAKYRRELASYFAAEKRKLLTGSEIARLADFFAELQPDDYESDLDRAIGRSILRRYKLTAAVPAALQAELDDAMDNAFTAFLKAREANDFTLCKTEYKRIFDLKKQICQAIDPDSAPFEVAMDIWDEGIRLDETAALFEQLKSAVSSMVKAIRNSKKTFKTIIPSVDYDKAQVTQLLQELVALIGLPLEQSSFGRAEHPCCETVGPQDARVAMNCDDLVFSIISTMHEAGHGMYCVRSDQELVDNGLWGGIAGAVHEGMARFYETILGRSLAFWRFFLPKLQQLIPGLAGISAEDFYAALNIVAPSPIRITADELTYNMHPIIRFEIERDYFAGRLDIDHMRDAWNAKYKEYLGVEPEDDLSGILQEGHWTIGYIGYFQSYVIGNLWCGQMLHFMKRDIPDVFNQIEVGNFEPFNRWITDHVHRFSQLYAPAELIEKATGEQLNAKYYIDYLREKYGALYDLAF